MMYNIDWDIDETEHAGKEREERYMRAGALSRAHWDSIAKPIDSLGWLEDAVVKLCSIACDAAPYDLGRRALVVMCGDHGVVSEGVTQTGSGVTRIVSENFAKGCSSVNYMAAVAGADVYTVDIGMCTPRYREKRLVQGAVVDRKVAEGTENLAVGPAMTIEQCVQAINTGIAIAGELKEMGYRVIATGEMGIGNTTPTSVLAAALLNLSAEDVTGRGAGLDSRGLEKKCRVVQAAAERIRKKKLVHPVELLAEAGGFELAGMTGLFLGGVKYEIPIVIDGAISAVSALAAAGIDRHVPDYALASHVSEERTGRLALSAMGLSAMLHGNMCLGEGTGAVALLPLLDMALSVYAGMGTFRDLSIRAYRREGKPEKKGI